MISTRFRNTTLSLVMLTGLSACENAPVDAPALDSELSIVFGEVNPDGTVLVSFWADGMEDCQTALIPLEDDVYELMAAPVRTEVSIRKTGPFVSASRPASPFCLGDRVPVDVIASTSTGRLGAKDSIDMSKADFDTSNSFGARYNRLLGALSLAPVADVPGLAWLFDGNDFAVTVSAEPPPPSGFMAEVITFSPASAHFELVIADFSAPDTCLGGTLQPENPDDPFFAELLTNPLYQNCNIEFHMDLDDIDLDATEIHGKSARLPVRDEDSCVPPAEDGAEIADYGQGVALVESKERMRILILTPDGRTVSAWLAVPGGTPSTQRRAGNRYQVSIRRTGVS
jgi:hypothetical protein